MQPSEKEVGLGQTFQVYLRGEPNQTVRVLLYFEGLERREGPGQGPFRIGLDANGTARLSYKPYCTPESLLRRTCEWGVGRYDIIVTSDNGTWLNKTRVTVTASDAYMWQLLAGVVLILSSDSQRQFAEADARHWAVDGFFAAIALGAAFIAWTEAAGPLELGRRTLRLLLRGPRWFLKFWFGRAYPSGYRAADLPDLAPKEQASANVQIYDGRADRHARKAAKLETRAKRRREAEALFRAGARHWEAKLDLAKEAGDG